MRSSHASVVVALVTVTACGIATTHEGELCDSDGDCPTGQACLRTHPAGIEPSRCQVTCPSEPGLCPNGGICETIWPDDARTSWACWPGGSGAYQQPCHSDFECGHGMYCSNDGSLTTSTYCVDGCSTTADCPLGLYCHREELERVCQHRCGLGGPCLPGSECIAGVCTSLMGSCGVRPDGTTVCAGGATMCGTAEGQCPDGQACDQSLMAPHRCRPYAEIGCFRTGCPAGQVCFEQCVPSHE